MKKFFAGGAALALAGAGSVALAGPLGAQDAPQTPDHTQYEAAISATSVAPGENVTVSSGDGSCTIADGYDLYGLYLDMFPAGTTSEQYAEGIGMVDSGFLPAPRLSELSEIEDESIFDGALAADGTFEVSFAAPETSDSYDVFGFCVLLAEADYEFLEEQAAAGVDMDDLEGMDDLNDVGNHGDDEDPCVEEPPVEEEEPPADEEPPVDPEEPPAEEVVDDITTLGGDHDDDDHGDDEEPPVDDEEPPVDDEEPPVDDEVPCDEEPPADDEEPPADEPREPDFLENEVFIASFTVTGGAPPVATPVGGSPSFTG